MRKDLLVYSVCVFLASLTVVDKAKADPNQISKIEFENNLDDPLGRVAAVGSPSGTADEAVQIVSYVSGRSGLAARSSHNNDDGAGDLVFQHQSDLWPASNQIYQRFWLKYENEYRGMCPNGIWNVKWFWTLGSVGHTELIFQNYNDSTSSASLSWQLSGGGTGWDGGTRITKYGAFNYQFGDWIEVEIYIKLSSGDTHMNPDGVMWVKVAGVEIISGSDVVTGVPGRITSPAIKASCDCAGGQGWWQIDQLEVWDGEPGLSSKPSAPSNLHSPSSE